MAGRRRGDRWATPKPAAAVTRAGPVESGAALEAQARQETTVLEARIASLEGFAALPSLVHATSAALLFGRQSTPASFRTRYPSWDSDGPAWPRRPRISRVRASNTHRGALKSQGALQEALRKLHVYEAAFVDRLAEDRRRIEQTAAQLADYDAYVSRIRGEDARVNWELQQLQSGYVAGEPAAIETLIDLVASKVAWPGGGAFPASVVHYDGRRGTLLVRAQLPGPEWLPAGRRARVARSGHSGRVVSVEPLNAAEAESLLTRFCAAWSLRVAAELLRVDVEQQVSAVAVNGYQWRLNPVYGREENSPCVCFELPRSSFDRLDLARVDPLECVRAHGEISLRSAVAPRPEQIAPTSSAPPPVLTLRHNHDGEVLAAEYMRWLGFTDSTATPVGSDGGIDVAATDAVAQVKMHAKPVGRPDIQRLIGAAHSLGPRVLLFFSQQGYGSHAIEFADQAGMALFKFNYSDGVEPVNDAANRLVTNRLNRSEVTAPNPYAELRRTLATQPFGEVGPSDDAVPNLEDLRRRHDSRSADEMAWIDENRRRLQSELALTESIIAQATAAGAATSGPDLTTGTTNPALATVPPMWAPDPYGRAEFRYYDGQRWTDFVANGGQQTLDPLG